MEKIIRVFGVKLDNEKKDIVDIDLKIKEQDLKDMDKDDIEDFIEDEISNVTGYCHFGWKYHKLINKVEQHEK